MNKCIGVVSQVVKTGICLMFTSSDVTYQIKKSSEKTLNAMVFALWLVEEAANS